MKNRRDGVFEPYLVGPYEFLGYKSPDKRVAVLLDGRNQQFECSSSYLVPLRAETDSHSREKLRG